MLPSAELQSPDTVPPISQSPLGSAYCSSVSSKTVHESDLTLKAGFGLVGVSPGEPGSLGSAEGQECQKRAIG